MMKILIHSPMKILFTCLFLITTLSLFGQEKIQLSGKVVDEKGESLPGATVQEIGTSNGTVTGIDGTYTLTVGSDTKIRVSYIGFIVQEITVSGRTIIGQ